MKKQTQQSFGDTIVRTFFKFQNELKLYHWQTHSYSRHKASDKLFESVLDLTDDFIETFMGKYNKRVALSPQPSLLIKSYQDDQAVHLLEKFQSFLMSLDKLLPSKPQPTDLLNIRDELLGKVNQTLYLFSLR